ncbi:hypothetical protein [Corallococcus llansteffanensis]|uniref:Uncharacterized protein n=1 Tax=Corallococcus llansteffanensis TaxID=2316731 RepID=A0A3A8QYR9_9BACT|nr:hypothetical protein [Corallococcus llansteffanensis]RKH68284.1 hypothetical protein D7V93_01580 [Corallococcus llansteffanensis]
MPDVTIVPVNSALTIERALYKLHGALTSNDYRSMVAKLPDLIKNTILPALGNILTRVQEVVSQFVNAETLKQLTSILNAGMDVVGATMDMLEGAALRVAETARRFLAIAADFIAVGKEHILAIIDLLGKIGAALANKEPKETALGPDTLSTVKALGLLALAA